MSNCCVVDGLVYAAEVDGYLHCLDAKTGEKYWTYDVRAEVWWSLCYADGKVFLGTNDGDLLVFEHSKVLKQPRAIPFDRSVRTPPCFAKSLFYVMTDVNLYAFGEK